MNLIIKNKIISAPIEDIISSLQNTSNNYLRVVRKRRGDDIAISCPFHKDGQEMHPSAFIYTSKMNDSIEYGTLHCFTCGKIAPLYSVVGKCLGVSDELGKEWLVDNFGEFFDEIDYLPEIDLSKSKKEFKDEDILEKYNQYHPYMAKRKLSADVIKKFKIGYDSENKMITFPTWDAHGNLVAINKRSVDGKKFILESGIDKPVYLLNFIINEHIDKVYVAESQINALTLWSWGYPAIAFMGTGTRQQYDILKKSGIRHYVMCLDPDDAGMKGTHRFIREFNGRAFISVKQIPQGKDVNDLSKEEFDKLVEF